MHVSASYFILNVYTTHLEDERMQRQLSYLSELLLLLEKMKRKIVIACVKCDAVELLNIRFGSNLLLPEVMTAM